MSNKLRSVLITENNWAGDPAHLKMKPNVRCAIWQMEKGKEGTIHLHLCIQYKNPVSFNSIKLDWPRANIEPCKNFLAAYNYCRKSETRIAGPFTHGSSPGTKKIEDLQAFMSSVDAEPSTPKLALMREHPDVVAKFPHFVKNYITETQSEARSKLSYGDLDHEWQRQLVDIVKEKADRRTVHWYWSEAGGTGKSKAATFLQDNFNAFVIDIGKSADVAYAYSFESVVVFDLPRAIKEDLLDHVYYLAEKFKDGRMFCPKYESCVKRFDPPHVVVFSNLEPNQEMMSADRWHIVNVKFK